MENNTKNQNLPMKKRVFSETEQSKGTQDKVLGYITTLYLHQIHILGKTRKRKASNNLYREKSNYLQKFHLGASTKVGRGETEYKVEKW